MRAISGTGWGATTKSLIAICRVLIRSVFDYGATAYDSASTRQLQKLDRIQYSALKLCCGAMKTTSASALQVECGEALLRLRRLQQQINFAAKVKSTSSHVGKHVFDDHWTTHYGRFSDNTKPLAVKVNQFFEDVDMTHVKGPRLGITPPWLVVLREVDRSVTLELGQQERGTKHPGCSVTGQDRSDVQPLRPDLHRRVERLIRKNRNWLLHSVDRVISRHRDGSQANR